LGLLKWSLAQQSDGTVPSEHTAMTEEDKRWLEQVMREAIKDEPKRMNEIMGEFVKLLEAGPTMSDSENIEDLLDELQQMVEQVDMAQVFAKFGGFQCLLGLVECVTISAQARAMAASTLGALSQNNISVQEIAYNAGILDKLAAVFLQTESPLLCTKVLYALSCSVRNHAVSEEYFVQNLVEPVYNKTFSAVDAMEVLEATATNSESSVVSVKQHTKALMVRAVFLANALIISDNSHTGRIVKLLPLLLVPTLFQGLHSDSIDLRENVQFLLKTVLMTVPGRGLLQPGGEHNARFLDAIQTREAFVLSHTATTADAETVPGETGADDVYSKEDSAHELSQLRSLRVLAISPSPVVRYPLSEVAAAVAAQQEEETAHTGAGTGASAATSESSNSDDAAKQTSAAPMLAIGMPMLPAAP
jgi:hypothetical protein